MECTDAMQTKPSQALPPALSQALAVQHHTGSSRRLPGAGFSGGPPPSGFHPCKTGCCLRILPVCNSPGHHAQPQRLPPGTGSNTNLSFRTRDCLLL